MGHWISSRGRRMHTAEMMRLQGVPVDFPICVQDAQFRKQLGNAMSISVLIGILRSLLPAAGWAAWVGGIPPGAAAFAVRRRAVDSTGPNMSIVP